MKKRTTEEIRGEMQDSMIQEECPFCHQYVSIMAPTEKGVNIDELVRMSCSCEWARRYQAAATNAKMAENMIMRRFGGLLEQPVSDENSEGAAVALLMKAAGHVARGTIGKVAIQANETTSFSMTANKEGRVIVEKKDVYVDKGDKE